MSDITDPIDGLIRYVNEIKPFHSKIIEVLTEYVYSEAVNVTASEDLLLDVGIVVGTVDVDSDDATDSYGGAYGNGPYDSGAGRMLEDDGTLTQGQLDVLYKWGNLPQSKQHYVKENYWPVISINPTIDGAFDVSAGSSKLGYNFATKTVVMPGDQTATYREDRYIVVIVSVHLTTGEERFELIGEPQIVSSTFVDTGQTGGISNYPRTELVLSALPDPSSISLNPGESLAARVLLQPTSILSVVAGIGNTGRVRYSTIDVGGSTIVPPYGIQANPAEGIIDQPQIPRTIEPYPYDPPYPTSPDIATLDNYVTLDGDATTSYPYGSALLMLLQSGETVKYTVSLSYYNPLVGDITIVELLQELDPAADYTNAQAIESFSGFANKYKLPTISTTNIPEGLTETNIAESVVFSWNDGTTELENFIQLQFVETGVMMVGGNPESRIVMAYDGRVLTDYISVGSTVRLIGNDWPHPGEMFTVDNISGNIITVNDPSNELNIPSTTGFIEPV